MLIYQQKKLLIDAYKRVLLNQQIIKEDVSSITSELKSNFGSTVDAFLKDLGVSNKIQEALSGANVRILTLDDLKIVLSACDDQQRTIKTSRLVQSSSKVFVEPKSEADKQRLIPIKRNGKEKNTFVTLYLDPEKLKETFLSPPKEILKQNMKIQHSGSNSIFLNLTMPAYHGLYYDEKANGFGLVKTCPGAGACVLYCYATKGGYLQYSAVIENAARMLTFLMNRPEEFKQTIKQQLIDTSSEGKQVVLRWHDSGDFFSTSYLDLAIELANELPDVLFYAYTKQIPMVNSYKQSGKIPKNFIFNFSKGGKFGSEIKNEDKIADVVPKELFKDLPLAYSQESIDNTLESFVGDNIYSYAKYGLKRSQIENIFNEINITGENLNFSDEVKKKTLLISKILDLMIKLKIVKKINKDKKEKIDLKRLKKRIINSKIKLQSDFTDKAIEILKKRTSEKFNIPLEEIITYDEMKTMLISNDKTFLDKNNYWSVLVWFGHGDDAASRKEVKTTLLLMH